ncbi:MAG TPA: DUF4124 domain-containing protein [Burkholderiales bacterium]|nr:DUF4124 domain-containing protein [Burkholderiales bacterium]
MRPTLLLVALVLASTAAAADKVYKWVDAQGKVLYTDQPLKGAEEITIARQPPSAAPGSFASLEEDRPRYSALTFGAPTNEATVRDNEGNVKIAVSVVPPLRADRGDQIKLSLDGGVLDADLSSSEVILSGLDQGTHTLQAAVTDKDGRVLIRSDPIEFYLKHWSINNPRGPAVYPPVYPSQLVPKH